MVARRKPVRARAAPRAAQHHHPKAAPAVDHVVLIIKENHSFDNYFGTFPGADGTQLPHSANPPPQDPDHRHGAWLTRHTTAVRAQFTEQDIPAYFAYARQFTLCDHYFTDVAVSTTGWRTAVQAAVVAHASGEGKPHLGQLWRLRFRFHRRPPRAEDLHVP